MGGHGRNILINIPCHSLPRLPIQSRFQALERTLSDLSIIAQFGRKQKEQPLVSISKFSTFFRLHSLAGLMYNLAWGRTGAGRYKFSAGTEKVQANPFDTGKDV
jgi:hypothetical protein